MSWRHRGDPHGRPVRVSTSSVTIIKLTAGAEVCDDFTRLGKQVKGRNGDRENPKSPPGKKEYIFLLKLAESLLQTQHFVFPQKSRFTAQPTCMWTFYSHLFISPRHLSNVVLLTWFVILYGVVFVLSRAPDWEVIWCQEKLLCSWKPWSITYWCKGRYEEETRFVVGLWISSHGLLSHHAGELVATLKLLRVGV